MFNTAKAKNAKIEKLLSRIKKISQINILKKKIGRNVNFPTMKCVSSTKGSTIQSASVIIPTIERHVETMGNQLKFIVTPNPLLKVTFSEPGSGKIFIDIIVNLSKI